MSILVIGGTSGLGLEIAKQFANADEKVIVTGRHDPKVDFAQYYEFDLAAEHLASHIKSFVDELPKIERLVYVAGYFQEGRVTDLTPKQIEEMINVGGRGLVYFVKWLLEKQSGLEELITITSTSQWTPRKLEPIYNFAKAGAGHFSNAMAEDGRISKVLVAGPAGMRTAFWKDVKHADLDVMLDPEWVAKQVMKLREDDYKYRFAKILRQPARVEIEETR